MNRFIIALTAAAIISGCSKEAGTTTDDQKVGYGRVAISTETFAAVESTESRSGNVATFTIPEELFPTDESVSLKIEGKYIDSDDNKEKDYSYSYQTLKEYNTADMDSEGNKLPPYIPSGTYTFTLTSITDIEDESATNAYFTGSAVGVVVEPRILDAEISILMSLKNSIIRLNATDDFCNYFAGGASLTASTEKGSKLYYTHPDNTSHEGKIIFCAPGTNLYLEGEGVKQAPTEDSESAPSVTFTKSLLNATTKEGYMTSIIVDAKESGSATISVTIDDTITEISSESFELNPIN